MESKRDFLKKISLLTAGGLMTGNFAPVIASAKTAPTIAGKKVIGLQIYSLMKELTENVPEGMKKIKEIGYSTIELAGYGNRKMGQYEVGEYRKIAEDAGLKITSAHVNPPERTYTKDNVAKISDWWKLAVEDHVKLGVGRLIQPGMPTIETHDDAKLVGEVFNNAGEIAKAAGIKWGYHNHNMEFKRIAKPGETLPTGPGAVLRPVGDIVYDLMMEATDPALVFFEMDVYWTVMGQMDPLDYFEKYPTRIQVLHIKDRSVLGQSGMMNFENIFKKAYSIGINEFYVEIEKIKTNMTQFEGVKGCFDYLNNASFVK
ncbi:sugar phosphate isomerase/epimerase [Aquipluma nitroreducens]|uniref:Sugar phosphate isomerase/epimerase n=2 Tax=Aquipluma nitroreducens TaxID=2010828 RepID=A0A5K7SGH7_9BACT|nr:sugar phosphate isomerase/epimerase [Aquipluma nitroreducens]